MELTLKAQEKKRNIATLEISKYLTEVACLLEAEVKMRNFEDLLDAWREKYGIKEGLEESDEGDYEYSSYAYSDYDTYDSYYDYGSQYSYDEGSYDYSYTGDYS